MTYSKEKYGKGFVVLFILIVLLSFGRTFKITCFVHGYPMVIIQYVLLGMLFYFTTLWFLGSTDETKTEQIVRWR